MLKKDITTQYGAKAKYWVVSKMEIDRIYLGVSIELYGYVSKEAEANKMAHIDKRNYYVSFKETLPEQTDESLKKIIPDQLITPELLELFHTVTLFGYGLVKQSEEFTDAEDDLIPVAD